MIPLPLHACTSDISVANKDHIGLSLGRHWASHAFRLSFERVNIPLTWIDSLLVAAVAGVQLMPVLGTKFHPIFGA